MYDFYEIHIPFKTDHVLVTGGDVGMVDFEELGRRQKLRIVPSDMEWSLDKNGKDRPSGLYHPWDNIPSSYTDIAAKVQQGNQMVKWPYLIIKASPAKVMQGHNIFGSDNFKLCVEFMLSAVNKGLPDIADMLDFGMAEISRIDCTYSVRMPNEDVLRQVLEQLSNVSHRYLRPSNEYLKEGTLYFNKSVKNAKNASGNREERGRTSSCVIYSKGDEVENQKRELEKMKRKQNTDRFDHVLEQLSRPELKAFSKNLLRFEGRAMKRFFKRESLPTNVWALIRYVEQFEFVNGYSFCEWMWKTMFRDLLDSFEGQKLKYFHDGKIRSLLRKEFFSVTKKGNITYAKADRLFRLYRGFCTEGYKEIKSTMNKSSFYRDTNDLLSIGLSKADMVNLKRGVTMPLTEVLKFDFDNQRPEGYVEPASPLAGIDDKSALAALFGVSRRLSIDLGTAVDPIEKLREKLRLPAEFDIDVLVNGYEIPITPRESVSMIIWPDGEVTLNRHPQSLFKPNPFTELINPHFDASGYESQHLTIGDYYYDHCLCRC